MQAELLRVGDVVIREIDVRNLTDDEIVAINDFGNIMGAESNPDDPPTPLDVAQAAMRNIPEFVVVHRFLALDPDGTIIGSASAQYMKAEENQHLVNGSVVVLADHRRKGIGTALLRQVVAATEAEGRTLIIGGTTERIPAGDVFAERVGAEAAQGNHVNRLLLADVDRDLVRRWIEDGPRRAPGYSLVWVDGFYPDDIIDDVVDVMHVMNDAPRDNVQMEDQHITVEHFRAMEKQIEAINAEPWSLFARHDATGQLVGLTDVIWMPAQPDTVNQGNTGVRPEHRGHALGKWLKASMLQRILDDRPGVLDIRTGNADSNEAMLGINRQLGFKPYRASTTWQVTVDRVREYLESR